MIVGPEVMRDGTAPTPYHSPSLPRADLGTVFGLDTTDVGESPTPEVTIEDENEDCSVEGSRMRLYKRVGSGAYYSDPLPRGGESGLFSIGVIEASEHAALTMTVQHRDDDQPHWSSTGTVSAMAPGFATKRIDGLKKELRIEIRHRCAEPRESIRCGSPEVQWL